MKHQTLTTLDEIAGEDMHNTENKILNGYPCPVCNFTMPVPPASFNICPSCGTEFGNDDADWTSGQLRQAWLESGAQWWSKSQPAPANWNPVEQVLPLVVGVSNLEEVTTQRNEQYVELEGNWTPWQVAGSSVETCRI